MPATERALELALTAAQAAADKKAEDIVILDVADQLVITDAFVVASAPNERQVLAIVDAIEERLSQLPEKAKPVRREGERGGRWVLLDYVDIVVHVQHAEEREFYSLDRLWKDCPGIAVRRPRPGRASATGAAGVGVTPADRLAARSDRLERRSAGCRGRSTSRSTEIGRRAGRRRGAAAGRLRPGRHRRQRPAPCRRTAAALAALDGVPVTYDPRLRERNFGEWEG